ncbi:MAG: radical SAM protein [Planctomycetota bacterium]
MTWTDEELKAMPVGEVVEKAGVAAATRVKYPGALLFTYRCSISCDHCLFGCGLSIPPRVMSAEDALEFLRQLHQTDRCVHIAGGEAFLFWDVLAEVVERAGKGGIAPHFIESNCSWAAHDGIVRERLSRLKDWGLRGMLFSADPYHQAHVPPENFIRARAIAREIFGPQNVLCNAAPDADIMGLPAIVRDEKRLAERVRSSPPKMVGNAAYRLGRFLPDLPLESLPLKCGWGPNVPECRGCPAEFDGKRMWEVHVDPYANIQTNCGVILGNAKKTPVADLLRTDFAKDNPIASILAKDGPFGLLEFAKTKGCPTLTHAKQKCHLCFLVRSYLRAFYPHILGPEEVYYAAAAAALAYRAGGG